jgi:phage shock protein PspC (stress-responsive transcriptional regulator)
VKSEKRLKRSRGDAVVAGVCGGIGDYFSIDPVIIRIIWVLFSFAGGSGLLAYSICWMIIPRENLEI